MIQNILILMVLLCTPTFALAEANLPKPKHMAVTGNQKTLAPNIMAARRYAAFWNTGQEKYAEEALAEDFTDQTLPPGRPQGKQGPLQASKQFRTAVPDLTAEIEDLVAAGDRVAVHLRFKGHFTDSFDAAKGTGQEVNFQAFDLYRVKGGKIVDNWHLEDNLTLLKQMDVIKK